MTITCPSDSELQRYVEGGLSDRARSELDAHVASCSLCAAVVASVGAALSASTPRASEGPSPTADSRAPSPEAGARVGRYVLLEPLGSGAMGAVFAAYDPQLDRRVALKLLRPGRDHLHAERMVREARLMARLTHPNVVTVHDAGELGDAVFIAMEAISGGTTVRDWIAREAPSWRAIVAAFTAAGHGLEAAHRAGIVHRDFKPDNVLRAADGRVLVTDFGLARSAEQAPPVGGAEPGTSPSPHASALVGTPAYMAPEQHRGERVGPAADVFAFCVALWEALFGGHPFGELGPDLAEAARAGRLRPPPPGRNVPSRIVRALEAGLAADPARRAELASVLAAMDAGTRRRWPWGVAAAALALAVGIGVAVADGAPLCQGAAERLAGVWDDTARVELDRALRGTGVVYAAESAAAVRSILDAYAARWVASHEAACVATRVDGAQSELVLDRRMLCLEERRRRLGALVGVLSSAASPAVQSAVQAAAQLPPVEDCDDLAYVAAAVAPPEAYVAVAVAEQRVALARARALFDAGDLEGSRRAADLVATVAPTLGYRPLVGELELVLGLLDKTGAPKSALGHFQSAALSAERSADLALLAEARVQIATELGWYLGDVDGAALWADLAAASIERLGGAPDLAARLARARADALFKAGRREDALAAHRDNLAYWQRAHPGGVMESELENQIGIDLAELGHLDEAKAAFERARALREALLGASHPMTIDLIGNLAYLERMMGHTDQALALSQQTIERRERAFGKTHMRLVGDLDNRMLMLSDLLRYEEAFGFGERALAIAESHLGKDSVELILILQKLAEVAARTSRADLAKELSQRAVAIARAHGPHHPELGRSLGFQGLVLQLTSGCAEALPVFVAAAAEYDAAGTADNPASETALDGAGECALAGGDVKGALAWHRRSLAVLEKTYGKEHPFLTDPLVFLGRALIAAGDPASLDEARGVLARGQAIAQSIHRADLEKTFTDELARLVAVAPPPTK